MTPEEIAEIQKELGNTEQAFKVEEQKNAGSIYCEWLRGRKQALEWVLNFASFYAKSSVVPKPTEAKE